VTYVRLNVIVEGQTEQRFIEEILAEHLGHRQIVATARAVETSRGNKGGLTSYQKAKNDIQRWLKEDRNANVHFTTMFDLYGLPTDFPGYHEALSYLPYERTEILEQKLSEDIADRRFIPYIQLHEFEALIFAAPEMLAYEYLGYESQIQQLRQIGEEQNPELINDSPATAPSKRILRIIPVYQKAVGGIIVASAIGVEKMRQRCSHFHEWLEKIEQLVQA